MSVMELAGGDLDREASREGVLAVHWGAGSAPASELSRAAFDATARANAGARFVAIDVSEHGALAREYQVNAVPTLMVFRDGLLVFAGAAPVAPGALDQLLLAVDALDMDEVRRARNGHGKGQPILPASWIERAAERVYESPHRR